MSVEREMSLAEWCAKLPSLHLVNQELSTLNTQLATLAEQNAKLRETLSRWRYQNLSYNWCCGNCGAVDGDEHKEGCALSLPDLASPVLNRIRAEGIMLAVQFCIDNPLSDAHCLAEMLRARADELRKNNA